MANRKLSHNTFAVFIVLCALGLIIGLWRSFQVPKTRFAGSIAKQLVVTPQLAIAPAFPQPHQEFPPQILKQPAQAPNWAIRYGQEFWRDRARADAKEQTRVEPKAALPTSVDLGEVIDRVSCAFEVTSDNGVAVEAKTYSAHLQNDCITFSPYRPVAADEFQPASLSDLGSYSSGDEPQAASAHRNRLQPDPDSAVSFRTLSASRGDQLLYNSAVSTTEWSVLGNTAQAQLAPASGLVEHFETRTEGVAITWIMSQPPSGAGPLVITAELSGMTSAGATVNGRHFADADGVARVRVGAVSVVDSNRRTWPIQMLAEGSRLRIEIPESILVEASYPLAIDPVISPEFGIDNPVLAPGPGEHSPAVAANGNNYLVVWEDTRHAQFPEYSSHIYGARVATNGMVLDVTGIPVCTVRGNQRAPKVAALGSDYLVVWADDRSPGTHIYATRVNTAGAVLHSDGFPVCTVSGNQDVPCVAASSNGFLVAWMDFRSGTSSHVYCGRVTSDGVVTDPHGIPVSPQAAIQGRPAVASNGEDFLVVWHDTIGFDRTISGARVTSSGLIADPGAIPISTRHGVQVDPSVASDGHDYLVAWYDDRNRDSSSGPFDIYGARVTASGIVLDANGIPICTAPAEQYIPAVAAGPNSYFVVWEDHRNGRSGSFDMFGARVTSAGLVLDPDGILIQLANRDNSAAGSPAVAAGLDGYFVVWADESIYGKRVNSAGTVLDADPIAIGQAAQREEMPAVASNGSEYLVVWLDWRGFTIRGSRVTALGEVADPSGLVIGPTVGGWPRVASDGKDFLVVWGRGAIVGARVSSAGIVLDESLISISRLPGQTSSAAVASNGKNYLVVWGYSFVPNDDNVPADPFHIHGARLSSAGELLDASELEFTSGEGNESSPAIASNGNEYLVVWDFGGVNGLRVNEAGIPIGPGPFLICTTNSLKTDLVVASNGRDYLAVWTDARNLDTTGLDIYGARVAHAGFALDPNGLPISRAPSAQSQPALASNGSDYLVVWTDERNLLTTGRDIYAARINAAGLVADPHGFAINHQHFDQQFPAVSYGGHGRFLVASQGFPDSSVRTVANLVSGIPPTPRLHILPKPNGGAILSWVAQEQMTYLVQFKDGSDASLWTTLGGECLADGPMASVEDNTVSSARLYRVVQIR